MKTIREILRDFMIKFDIGAGAHIDVTHQYGTLALNFSPPLTDAQSQYLAVELENIPARQRGIRIKVK